MKKTMSKRNKINKRISKKRKIGGSGKFTITDNMLNAAQKRREARLQMKKLPSLEQARRKMAMNEIEYRRKMRGNSTDPSTRPHPVAKRFSDKELKLLAAYYDAEAQARENERAKDLKYLPPISENVENEKTAYVINNNFAKNHRLTPEEFNMLDNLAEGGN
jgi:hypothetical protein